MTLLGVVHRPSEAEHVDRKRGEHDHGQHGKDDQLDGSKTLITIPYL